MRYRVTTLLFLLVWTVPFLRASGPPAGHEDYRLVLVMAIDQGRADYMDRFAGILEGGLGRILREGVMLVDAHQDHAITATGPGHTTIATGSYPSRSGIVGNQWREDGGRRSVYCVEDPRTRLLISSRKEEDGGEGRSPRNLLVTGLPDWLKAANPESKAFSTSRKDRAAVLMGGKGPDAAYWYDEGRGIFVSSTYYLDRLPEWVSEFNERRLPDSYFGRAWTPHERPGSPEELAVVETDAGWFTRGFPHALGGASTSPDSSFYSGFGATPMMDEFLLEFSETLIREEGLGTRGVVDYLAIGLSVLDSVGHSYGPNSPEVLDQFLRLDRRMEEFLRFIDGRIGLDRVLLVFTSDHGVMDLPEYRTFAGLEGGRLGDAEILCVQNQGQSFMERYGAEEDWFLSGYYLNYEAIGRRNLLRSEIERDAAALLEECSFIRKVWTRNELEKASSDPFHRLYRNSFHPDRSPDLMVQTEENFLASRGTGTSHGSPYRYDTHVPMIFRIPGVPPARVDGRTATVDIAPTLAALLGVPIPLEIDGRDLSGKFGGQR
jgi:predicted AlkP superfamily pyrophosphatase or phosphodiesterase